MSVTSGWPESPQGNMSPTSTVYFGWFVAFTSIKIFRVKLIEMVIVWVNYTTPFWFQLV